MRAIAETLGMDPIVREQHVVETTDDVDQIEKQVIEDLDDVIGEGITAMREAFAKAGDWKPSDQNRARESGAVIMKGVIDALSKKHDISEKKRDRMVADSRGAAVPSQVNMNFFSNRNDLMKMIKQGGLDAIVTEVVRSAALDEEPK
jgi:hypothetical protein